jgi:MFS family permease
VFTVAFFAGTFGLNFQMTSALMATQVFHKGAGQYGALGSIMAVGSLAGALLAARRGYPRRLLLVLSAIGFAVAEIISGLLPSYDSFAVWLPLVGLTSLTMLNSLQTVVQLSVPPEIRGRVVALYLMTMMGGTPFGAPLIGWVGQTYGARWMLIGGGLVTGLAVVGATWWMVKKQSIDVREVVRHPMRVAA